MLRVQACDTTYQFSQLVWCKRLIDHPGAGDVVRETLSQAIKVVERVDGFDEVDCTMNRISLISSRRTSLL
jgi:hypothetical protein